MWGKMKSYHAVILGLVFVLGTGFGADAQRVAPEIGKESPITRSSPDRSSEKNGENPGDSFSSGWRICNESDQNEIWVAYSYLKDDDWFTAGWRKIVKNKCEIFLTEIENEIMYYHAFSFDGPKWGGDIDLCAHPTKKFDYVGDMKVCTGELEIIKFNRVDTEGKSGWTVRLTNG